MAEIIFKKYIGMLPVSQNALTSGTYRNKIYTYTAPLTAGEYYQRFKMRLQVIFSDAMQSIQRKHGTLTFVLKLPHDIAGKTRYDLDNFAYPIFTSSKQSGLMRLIDAWSISKSHDVQGGFEVSIYEGC
jgi:hypothetical protein